MKGSTSVGLLDPVQAARAALVRDVVARFFGRGLVPLDPLYTTATTAVRSFRCSFASAVNELLDLDRGEELERTLLDDAPGERFFHAAGGDEALLDGGCEWVRVSTTDHHRERVLARLVLVRRCGGCLAGCLTSTAQSRSIFAALPRDVVTQHILCHFPGPPALVPFEVSVSCVLKQVHPDVDFEVRCACH